MDIISIIDYELTNSNCCKGLSVDGEINNPLGKKYRVAGFFCLALSWGGAL